MHGCLELSSPPGISLLSSGKEKLDERHPVRRPFFSTFIPSRHTIDIDMQTHKPTLLCYTIAL